MQRVYASHVLPSKITRRKRDEEVVPSHSPAREADTGHTTSSTHMHNTDFTENDTMAEEGGEEEEKRRVK